MKHHALLAVLCVALSLAASHVLAHHQWITELTLREQAPGKFEAQWVRTEGLRNAEAAELLLKPVFPEHCRVQWPKLDCASGGLTGKLAFLGLGNLQVDVLVNVVWLDAAPTSLMFTTNTFQRELSAAGQEAFGALAASFTRLGVEHIWAGIDHLLFVLGLVWLVNSLGMLLKTITAFTVAHSVTLALSILGGYSLPSAPVEAAIALSVALVAVETLHKRAGRLDLGARIPWLLALGFGLLHGFGFASALEELSLVHDQRAAALLFFNVGVEIGQLAFVVVILGVQRAMVRLWPRRPAVLGALAPYAVGSVAMAWSFERMLGF